MYFRSEKYTAPEAAHRVSHELFEAGGTHDLLCRGLKALGEILESSIA